VKLILILVFSALLVSCQVNQEGNLKELGEVEARDYRNALSRGQSIVIGDVFFDDKYCASSVINFEGASGGDAGRIINGSIVSAGIWKDKAVIKPGDYVINGVRCGDVFVSLGGGILDKLSGLDEVKSALAPKFSIKGGTIFHMGTMQIVTVKKGTLFSNTKVFVVRKLTKPDAKKAAERVFGPLSSKLRYSN